MDSGRQSIRFSLTYNSGGILSGPLDRLLLSFSMAFKTLAGLNETSQRGSKFTLASEQVGNIPLSTVPTPSSRPSVAKIYHRQSSIEKQSEEDVVKDSILLFNVSQSVTNVLGYYKVPKLKSDHLCSFVFK